MSEQKVFRSYFSPTIAKPQVKPQWIPKPVTEPSFIQPLSSPVPETSPSHTPPSQAIPQPKWTVKSEESEENMDFGADDEDMEDVEDIDTITRYSSCNSVENYIEEVYTERENEDEPNLNYEPSIDLDENTKHVSNSLYSSGPGIFDMDPGEGCGLFLLPAILPYKFGKMILAKKKKKKKSKVEIDSKISEKPKAESSFGAIGCFLKKKIAGFRKSNNKTNTTQEPCFSDSKEETVDESHDSEDQGLWSQDFMYKPYIKCPKIYSRLPVDPIINQSYVVLSNNLSIFTGTNQFRIKEDYRKLKSRSKESNEKIIGNKVHHKYFCTHVGCETEMLIGKDMSIFQNSQLKARSVVFTKGHQHQHQQKQKIEMSASQMELPCGKITDQIFSDQVRKTSSHGHLENKEIEAMWTVSLDETTEMDEFLLLNEHLNTMDMYIKQMPGDGSCLFHSLVDQLEGDIDQDNREFQASLLRQDIVEYIRRNRKEYETFVNNMYDNNLDSFDKQLDALANNETWGGEECISAFVQLHNVTVVIHQYGNLPKHFEPNNKKGASTFHISYHGNHYNSVRKLRKEEATNKVSKLLQRNLENDTSNDKGECPSETAHLTRTVPTKNCLKKKKQIENNYHPTEKNEEKSNQSNLILPKIPSRKEYEEKVDRPFICEECNKSFKFKCHMKTHIKSCKGEERKGKWFSCDQCGGKFSFETNLKRHKKTCSPQTEYICEECTECFVTLQEHYNHKRKYHSSLHCEHCDKKIANDKNMKRHYRLKHKGLTPSKAYRIKMRSKDNHARVNKCEECGKSFYDKSTLNRHKKKHQIQCQKCGNICRCRIILKNKRKSPADVETKKKSNVIEHFTNTNKHVNWDNNLENVKEIPITKISFNLETSSRIKLMFEELERFMVFHGNRGQSIPMKKMIETYERNSKKNFDEQIFKALLTVNPEAYKIELNRNEVHIMMLGGAKPSKMLVRQSKLREELSKLETEKPLYIDLAEIEEPKKIKYKSAKITIMENLMNFGDDVEDTEEMGVNQNKCISSYEELKKKIERKQCIKKKREKQMESVDWQLMRLPNMIRKINNVFLTEKKASLKTEDIITQIEFMGYSSNNIENDLERLIQNSNNWLTSAGGRIKRNSNMDINHVLNMFKIK